MASHREIGAIRPCNGSKFKAVNNHDRNYTAAKVAKRIGQGDASIERYLATRDRADRKNNDISEARTDC